MSYKPKAKPARDPLFVVQHKRGTELVYSTNCGSLVESQIVAFNRAREIDPVTNADTINSFLNSHYSYAFEDHVISISKVN